MRLQQSDNLNKRLFQKIKTIIPLILSGIMVFIYSCDNDIETVNLLSEKSNFPDHSMTDANITHTKNGQVTVRIISPKINQFTTVEEPYIKFPEGLHVKQLDSTGTLTSEITANYAIYHQSDKLWEAENDVVAINDKGDTLNTEYLIWNEAEEIIHTDRYVRIKTPDGIIHGKGMEANQNFTNWKIKETSGTLEVKEDE
ncbi:MAG: LPS export ABC transporter periplasmic protein LptC [Bacteroidota bacterium]